MLSADTCVSYQPVVVVTLGHPDTCCVKFQGQDVLRILRQLPDRFLCQCQPLHHALAAQRALTSGNFWRYHRLMQDANWQQQALMRLKLPQVGV